MPGLCGGFGLTFLLGFAGFGPATLEFEREDWENRLAEGNIPRQLVAETLAIRGDGARAIDGEVQAFAFYLIASSRQRIRGFFDAGQRQFHWIDNSTRSARISDNRHVCPLPPLWHPEPKGCIADSFGATRLRDRTHLGMRVVVWSLLGGTELWLAPRLGCAAVRTVTIEFGDWHIPFRYHRHELKRIRLGEPEAKWFEIPAGYRIERNP